PARLNAQAHPSPGKGGATLTKKPDRSFPASGKNPPTDVYTIVTKTPLTGITAIRLEVLPDPTLPAKGPGRAANGNLVLTEFKVSAIEQGKQGNPTPVALFNAQATFSQPGLPIGNAIDNNPATGWAIFGRVGKPTEAMFQLKQPLNFAKGAVLTVTLEQNFAGKLHNIGKFRLSVSTTKGTLALSGPPANIAAILAVAKDKRTAAQVATLTAAYRAQDKELGRLAKLAAKMPMPVDKRHPGAQDLVWALINSKAFQFNH